MLSYSRVDITENLDQDLVLRQPEVTIVMAPRERFSFMQRSIESLYDDQRVPFNFICVNGGSPRRITNYLRSESRRRNFKLIHKPYCLTPNEARNLALDDIKTRYVVFIDNDIIFAPMWLKHLVDCADETDATIVSPLTCIGLPVHTTIHMAGGDASIIIEGKNRIFRESHHFPNQPIIEVRDRLVRKPIELAEFHCMLVKTEWLKQIGRFDENIKGTSDHTDFCFTARQHNRTILIEPRAVVTQLFGPPLSLSDLKFFYCRWSNEWTVDSERYFHKKWGTVYDDNVLKSFVIPRRRHALPRIRQMVRELVGWRISEWLFNRIGDAFFFLANWGRTVAISKKSQVELAGKNIHVEPSTHHQNYGT